MEITKLFENLKAIKRVGRKELFLRKQKWTKKYEKKKTHKNRRMKIEIVLLDPQNCVQYIHDEFHC